MHARNGSESDKRVSVLKVDNFDGEDPSDCCESVRDSSPGYTLLIYQTF